MWRSWIMRTNEQKHYCDVIMSAMASQITSLMIVYSTVYSGAYQEKDQSSASLAFVRRIHRWPVNSPHKGPVTWKTFPFDDVTMNAVGSVIRFPHHCVNTFRSKQNDHHSADDIFRWIFINEIYISIQILMNFVPHCRPVTNEHSLFKQIEACWRPYA